MSTEENKAIVRRFYEEVMNQGDLSVVDEIVAPHMVDHSPGYPEYHTGPEGIKQTVTAYRAAFPDMHDVVEDVIAEGDKVTVRWSGRGTHRGELMGMEPSGKDVTLTGITVYRIEDGKIVERWSEADELGMMRQLDADAARDRAGA